MVDEPLRRLPTHQPGREIRLADGGSWSLPNPPASNGACGLAEDPDYEPLLDAACEADCEAERSLAALALLIFLLGRNYDLGPSDYQELLTFPPNSPALHAWREDLRGLLREHLQARGSHAGPSPAATTAPLPRGWLARLLVRFRPWPTGR